MTRSLVILYGSETGCAQDVAESLGRQARRRHFKTKVLAMDDYDKSQLIEEKLVVFVCSTTGQGAEPANMKQFWRFLLRKNLPNDILCDLDCAVIGLGDSSYRNFNFPSKKLYRRLIQLGANMLINRCDCDDQHYQGLDGALVPWTNEFWDTVLKKYPTTEAFIPDNELLPPSFRMEFIDENRIEPKETQAPLLAGEFNLTVKENTRITSEDHFQDVRHIQLDCQDPGFKYEPGDIAVMTPQNLVPEVELFLEYLGWSEHADKWIRLSPTNEDQVLPPHWPRVMKFKDLFVHHLDVFGVPRRSFFEMLSYFTKDENHTERLREFITPEGQEDMWNYCQRLRRHIAEVLFDFQPFSIPFDYIIDLFPPLQPRSYSIASCLEAHPHTLELCVAVVKYKTKLRKIRRGVFTKWLSTWKEGDVVPRVRIAKGTMSLPPSDTPLIAIGPGTGIAPMRSFLEKRILIEGATDNTLLFGCRYENKDFYYKEQWKSFEKQLNLITAFSRDQDKKVYVQDKIREHSALFWDLIENQQAKIVLSGSLDKMPGEVAYAFKQVFMKEGKLSVEQAENYFLTMNKTGQYQEECWN